MKFELKKLEQKYLSMLDRMESNESLFEVRNREGVFSPAVIMWLMINGRAKGRRSLMDALESLAEHEASEVLDRSGTKKVRITPVSMNSGGLSRAREKLSLDLVRRVGTEIANFILKDKGTTLWRGRRVFLCDGTIIGLTRTEDHVKAFRPTQNQHGMAYTPNFLCLCCHELYSGVALMPRYGAYRGESATSEPELYYGMLEELPKESLIILDRNFGIFPVAYAAAQRKHHLLVRLTETRAKGFDTGKESCCEDDVEWKFRQSRAAEQLKISEGAILKGRFIKHTVKRKGCRDLKLLFFTNSDAPAAELIELYLQRERIENDIRTLKHTIGMERLFAETPDGIAKELLLGVTAYNLIRAIIADAAKELGLLPRQLSFTRAARFTQIFGNRLLTASTEQERRLIREHFLAAMRQTKIPNRKKQRIEPRKKAYGRQKYSFMTESREKERQNSRELLAINGHLGYSASFEGDS